MKKFTIGGVGVFDFIKKRLIRKRILIDPAVAAACLFIQCLKGPSAVEEKPHNVPEKAVQVVASDFDSKIAASRVAVVEFFSGKCPVCASLAWIIDSIYTVFGEKAFVGANNTDKDTLYRRFSIHTVPTYIFFKDGQEATRRIFTKNDSSVFDTLAAILEGLLADTISPDYLTLDESSFDSVVLRKGTTVMVYFHCSENGSCVSMDSVVRALVPVFEGRAIVARVRILENPVICDRYGITDIPQVLFFKDSVYREDLRFAGFTDGDTLAAVLERLLSETPLPEYLTLDESSFDSVVLRKGTTAMVYFLYPFGAPCIYMDSVVRLLAPRFEGRAIVAKVHAWDNMTLSERYEIDFVPQFLFFKDSVLREDLRLTGIVDGDTLAARLERLLSETDFDRVVMLNKSNFADSVNIEGRVAMVDFFLSTCHTCQAMSATVAELADTFYGTALIGKVDCNIEDSLDDAFGVQWVPTFIFFKGGAEYYRCTGTVTFDTLAAKIREGLATATESLSETPVQKSAGISDQSYFILKKTGLP